MNFRRFLSLRGLRTGETGNSSGVTAPMKADPDRICDPRQKRKRAPRSYLSARSQLLDW